MLIIQFGVLVFLENVYFVDSVSYSSTKIKNDTAKEAVKPKLILENGSSNITASFDGKYLAYLKDNNLFVLNSENAEKTKVSANDGMEISYYKWLYDRNRLVLVERPISPKNGAYFKFYYYDMNNKAKVEIFNEVNNRNIEIPMHNINEKISLIDMSTLTNVIYVKLSNLNNNYSKIYRINIMAQENSINTGTHNIGKIASTKQDDVLIYENLDDKKVFSSNNNLPIEIEGNSNLSLLGVDNSDNVYLALTNDNKTQLIYYGNISGENWQKIDIKTSVDTNNIYVNFKGQIFIKDSSKSTINEFLTGKETYYNGNIIDIYNEGIISEKNNQIIKTIFQ